MKGALRSCWAFVGLNVLLCMASLMHVIEGRFPMIDQRWARTIGSVLKSGNGAKMIV